MFTYEFLVEVVGGTQVVAVDAASIAEGQRLASQVGNVVTLLGSIDRTRQVFLAW